MIVFSVQCNFILYLLCCWVCPFVFSTSIIMHKCFTLQILREYIFNCLEPVLLISYFRNLFLFGLLYAIINIIFITSIFIITIIFHLYLTILFLFFKLQFLNSPLQNIILDTLLLKVHLSQESLVDYSSFFRRWNPMKFSAFHMNMPIDIGVGLISGLFLQPFLGETVLQQTSMMLPEPQMQSLGLDFPKFIGPYTVLRCGLLC